MEVKDGTDLGRGAFEHSRWENEGPKNLGRDAFENPCWENEGPKNMNHLLGWAMCLADGEITDEGNLAPKVVQLGELMRAVCGDLMPVANANRKREVRMRVAAEREDIFIQQEHKSNLCRDQRASW